MTTRRDRNFELIVNNIEVRPPRRIVFSATKSIHGKLNKLTVSIYNQTTEHQLDMVRDAEDDTIIPVLLSVGYEDRLESIFKGDVITGSNARSGGDIITKLDCFDGGIDYRYAYTNKTIAPGGNVIDSVLDDMPNTTKGKVAERPELTRPKVLIGPSATVIGEMIGDGEDWYIEDGQLYILKDSEVTSGYVPVVSSDTGLMTTPERSGKEITFKTKMNAALKIGKMCQIKSSVAPHLNDVYKIETITYSGDYEGGPWDQTCVCVVAQNVVVV